MQSVLVRVGEVQVVAEHGDIDAVFFKLMPQIHCITGGQGTGRAGHIPERFAQRQMSAGKALPAHQREHLFKGQFFGVMETQAELDHGRILLFRKVLG